MQITGFIRMEVLGYEISNVTLIIGLALLWFIRYAFFGFDFFEKQGIPTVRPVYPLVGSIWNLWKQVSTPQSPIIGQCP
jgi:hypothetical protein